MTTALPITISARVDQVCAEGDDFLTQSRFAAAILRYCTAFRLLPRPVEKWSCTPRILAAMVDACFAKSDYAGAKEAALAALDCPDVGENPALRFKLGQISFEQGDLAEAQAHFNLALAHGGPEVFADEDPKYWEFVANQAQEI
jgi:tetratricopeptide (TPR) repeat protein